MRSRVRRRELPRPCRDGLVIPAVPTESGRNAAGTMPPSNAVVRGPLALAVADLARPESALGAGLLQNRAY